MIAQLYSDADYVRVFLKENDALMDCHTKDSGLRKADLALKRCRILRKTKWESRSWGHECRCHFKREAKK